MMKTVIDVPTGHVKVGRQSVILRANGIGSCVVVVIYNVLKHIGGMAHIMLPGKATQYCIGRKTKYAWNAIHQLSEKISRLGGCKKDSIVCLIGGANVLKRDDDTIAQDNIASILSILSTEGYIVMETAVGGDRARNASLDVAEGAISVYEGTTEARLLWHGGHNREISNAYTLR